MADITARVVAVLAAAGMASGCHSFAGLKEKAYSTARSMITTSYDDPQAEAKITRAEELMAAGSHRTAEPLCRDVASNTHNPVLLAEKARFLEAECLRHQGDYPAAVDTYHRAVVDFPGGAYRERACQEMFKIADYWLDDTRAEFKAGQAGESTLALKLRRLVDFDRTKPTLDREGRAVQALEHVHTNDITGTTADKALFWCGYVNFYRGNYIEADHYFSLLVEMHKDSPLRPLATELAVISKNNSTGGAVYDGQKAAEALQLVHHAEATMPEFRTEEKAAFLTRQKLAIRMQQAEKDYKTAEYYERTKHPGSAYFYYELVRRRYPGTKWSDQAAARLEHLKAEAEKGPPPPGPLASVKNKWNDLIGKPKAEDTDPPPTGPQGPPPPTERINGGFMGGS